MEIARLQERHADDAVRLFAASYEQERAAGGVLPCRSDVVQAFAPRIARLAAEQRGVVALEGARFRGYLAGFPLDGFRGPHRGVFCPEWAHGATGPDRARVCHALYAEAARQWVEDGCFAHALTLFAHDDEARDAWFREGFGLSVVDAMRRAEPVSTAPPAGMIIRRATVDDVDRLWPLQQALARHIAGSPILVRGIPPITRELVADLVSRPGMVYWLAVFGTEQVGYIRTQAHADDVAAVVGGAPANRPITGAFTAPAFRGRGVATALLSHVVERAREEGCATCSVDFESQNGEARRLWLRHFTPVCHSVVRRIDERPSAV